MKKLYLSIMAGLLAFSAGARELTFYNGDEPITPGSTINFEDIQVEDLGDIKIVQMAPKLYVSSDIFTTDLTVTATCTSGQSIQLCLGGTCQPGVSVTKTAKAATNEKIALQFDYMATLGAGEDVPTVTTLIEAQDGTHADTHISFTIVMGKNLSVEVIENSTEIYFTPAGLVYDLEAPAAFALYSTDGTRVMAAELEGNGTLATDGIEAGIYVYTLGAKSGKIYIGK